MLWKQSDSQALTATPPVNVSNQFTMPTKEIFEGTLVVWINLAHCGRGWAVQCVLWGVVRLMSLWLVLLAMWLVEMLCRTFMMVSVAVVIYVVQL